MDEAAAKLIAERGVWLSTQPFPDEMANAFPPGSQEHAKGAASVRRHGRHLQARQEAQAQDGLRHRHPLFAGAVQRQGGALGEPDPLVYSGRMVLVMATSTNGELLALSGKRNPYPGKLGVVEEGAPADLLLIDGNPLENIELIADPDKNFVVIMKDGKIYKNNVVR